MVSVRAASLNFPDVLVIQNKYQLKPQLPFIPGKRAGGRGEGTWRRRHLGVAPGDRVMAPVSGWARSRKEIAIDAAK